MIIIVIIDVCFINLSAEKKNTDYDIVVKNVQFSEEAFWSFELCTLFIWGIVQYRYLTQSLTQTTIHSRTIQTRQDTWQYLNNNFYWRCLWSSLISTLCTMNQK